MSTPATPTEAWVARPLGELLDALSSRSAHVGGGSVAAVAAAMAAALVERCAAEAGSESARARAAELRAGLAELADADAVALAALMRGSAERVDPETAGVLAEAASVPMRRLRLAVLELAGLAEELERNGKPWLRGEAVCARKLAGAAEEVAAAIIEANARPGPARTPASPSGTPG